MDLNEFIKMRETEKNWLNINGYECCDSNINGEFKTLETFNNSFELFIDIGANLGEFTFKVLNDSHSNILAFEPNKQLYNNLFSKLPQSRALVFEKALADKPGKLPLLIHPKYHQTSSLFKRTEMMPSFTQEIMETEVDVDILNNYYDIIVEKSKMQGLFIKVDVEGAEYLVLKGSDKVLSMEQPIAVIFEYSYCWKETSCVLKDAFHLLDSLGYKVFRITPLGLEHMKFYTQDMDNYYYCNYIATKNIDMEKLALVKNILATKKAYTEFFSFQNDAYLK